MPTRTPMESARSRITARKSQGRTDKRRSGRILKPAPPPPLIEKRHVSIRFPRTLLEWLNYPLASLSNHGMIGTQPRRHIVLCGFPRAGTTLLQLIVQACVKGVQGFPIETRALHVARFATKRAPYLFTKRPGDIFRIEEILRFYERRPTRAQFLLMMRDPRAVMTSVHVDHPDRYACSTEWWKATWDHWAWARQFPQVRVVRYEELIRNPVAVQAQLCEQIGWPLRRSFDRFHEQVDPDFRTRALNGVRALDPSTINRWRDPRHRNRLRQIVRELPDLPQILCNLGYETDHAWIPGGDTKPGRAA